MRRFLTFILFFAAIVYAKAQDDPEYRMEIGAGAGLVNYEGDFNGNLFGNMQSMGTIVGRYNFNPYSDLKLTASYGKLKGSSKDVETYYPDYRETPYEFNNSLIDVSLVYEYNLWPYGTGRDYRGSKRFTPFIFGGLGATSVSGGDKNVFTMNVPVGIGVKYKMTERMNIGLEYAVHFSLSDELDGVKDPYYVKSSGAFKNTDCYTALQLTLTYSFSAKCRTCNSDKYD